MGGIKHNIVAGNEMSTVGTLSSEYTGGHKRSRSGVIITLSPTPSPTPRTTPALLDWAKSLAEDDYDSDDEEEECLSDTDSCFLTVEEREQETRAVQALVKAAFNRTLTEPYLTRLIGPEPLQKRAKLQTDPHHTNDVVSIAHVHTVKNTKPQDFLRDMILSEGGTWNVFSALSLNNFFCEITPEFVEAHDCQITKAVREEDILTLQRRMENGKTLHCGNKFGESLVHAACRLGSIRVLKFLLEEAKVPCRVRCDSGRTPLHDACWTSTPNFAMVGILLDTCPDLLFIADNRGCTPLAYTRDLQSAEWCDFLSRRGIERISPKILGYW